MLLAPERRIPSASLGQRFFGNHDDCGGFGERLFVARNGGDHDVHQFFDIHLREAVGRSYDMRPAGEFQNEKSLRALPHLRRAR